MNEVKEVEIAGEVFSAEDDNRYACNVCLMSKLFYIRKTPPFAFICSNCGSVYETPEEEN